MVILYKVISVDRFYHNYSMQQSDCFNRVIDYSMNSIQIEWYAPVTAGLHGSVFQYYNDYNTHWE